MKDAQATGDAFSSQKKPSSTSKPEISSLFSLFGSGSALETRIWIQPTKINADLDPQPRVVPFLVLIEEYPTSS